MGNESWKGHEGYLRAEEIRNDLRRGLGREPTKGDFRDAERYNVWIALHRHGRKSFPDEEECKKQYNRIREGFLKSDSLMKRMLDDVCAILGPDEVRDLVEKRIRKKK